MHLDLLSKYNGKPSIIPSRTCLQQGESVHNPLSCLSTEHTLCLQLQVFLLTFSPPSTLPSPSIYNSNSNYFPFLRLTALCEKSTPHSHSHWQVNVQRLGGIGSKKTDPAFLPLAGNRSARNSPSKPSSNIGRGTYFLQTCVTQHKGNGPTESEPGPFLVAIWNHFWHLLLTK